MSVRTRENLYELFKNTAIPTEQDFKDLIDSMVNKQSDRFFGEWKSGMKYCIGDVVLHEKSLYMLTMEGDDEDCDDVVTPAVDDCDDDNGSNCMCSSVPPGPDNLNWCLLQLDMTDNDWKVVEPVGGGTPEIMYAEVHGIKVGIGTETPDAQLMLSDAEMENEIRLDTQQESQPYFQMANLSVADDPVQVKKSLGEIVEWKTNAPLGYVFKKMDDDVSGHAVANTKSVASPSASGDDLLLVLITTNDDRPAVGIGTDSPDGMLDVRSEGLGQVIVQPEVKQNPEIILVTLNPTFGKNYLASGIGEEYAVFTTDAEKGFRFKRGKGYSVFSQDADVNHGQSLMVIDGNGNVGIGTENPVAHLQITDHKSGDFRIVTGRKNPASTIVNIRPTGQANYIATGVDNDQAIFVTDSQEGFTFREGEKFGKDNSEEKVNQGDDLVRIEGRVKTGDPNQWDTLRINPTLDVNGVSRTYGHYHVATRNEMDETGTVEDVLNTLCEITPIRFKWNDRTRIGNIGTQIGLRAHEVEEYFPELVMKRSDGSKGIAYQNFVPVLLQAINELRERVEQLESQLNS